MTAVMMRLSEPVSDERGTFRVRVMARERTGGSWEGWLEFVPADNESCRYATPIETRQHDRVTMERWASGLTAVYAEGALARARMSRRRNRRVGAAACAAGSRRGVGPSGSASRARRGSDDSRQRAATASGGE